MLELYIETITFREKTMKITVALTGASGAMGGEVLSSLLQSGLDIEVRCILFE